ncbi:uncharacterized protein LOC129919284 [Episyrphus balteatus]|uniref:uncharacterized protein LOC129919284 n=1 Tax=Episyrphus balteatus TaxID=286459 RepID=UPI002486B1D0|nr:uncharacterized protein LOC129919284 [Episyrphus balteatus]
MGCCATLRRSFEATTLVGALFGLVALMLVFFLFINRKWCFHASSHAFPCCDDNNISSKYVQKLSRKRRYENTSSDSEEEILRRLRLQQSRSIPNGQYTGYGINHINPLAQNYNFSDLQHITVTPRDSSKDPLAIAERGKVGIPSSHSECSSNDSIEASIDSNTRILTGEKKGLFDNSIYIDH